MAPRKINIPKSVDAQISDVFQPYIVGDVNESQVKVAKFGEVFDWHADEDEAFLVLRRRIAIDFRDSAVKLGEGNFPNLPRTVEHRPRAHRRTGGSHGRTGDNVDYR